MGNTFKPLFQRLYGKKEIRILLVGLAAVGKRTILNKLRAGETVQTSHSGEIMKLEYRNIHLTMFDVGGDNGKFRWRHLCLNTDALVFVVDSTDRERIGRAREVLMRMLSEDELRDAVLLVLCNKQDLPDAMNTAEVTDVLGLHSLRQRVWYTQATATNGDRLYEGLDWLTAQLKSNM